MVAQNLKDKNYHSKEAQLFILKDKADRVSNFIRGLRSSKSKVYLEIMNEVNGIDSLITLQSLLLQISLYYKKFSDSRLNSLLEVRRAHLALANYYGTGDFSQIIKYLKEIKTLFDLVKIQ